MNKLILPFIIIFFFQTADLTGQIRLPKLISDGVILQRETDLKVWGWASESERITLTFRGDRYKTQADDSGRWEIVIPAQDAGGPYEMTFKGKNEIKIRDILFGDVWICSGQSNMELTMERVKEKYSGVIKNAENTNIRQFLVPDRYDFKRERKDLEEGSWISANPQTVLGFSAVAYFFATRIYDQYHVPIGLINASLGGSPVGAWMSEEALMKFPDLYREAQRFKNDALIAEIERNDRNRMSRWYRELNDEDLGIVGKWTDPDLDDSDWAEMTIPGYWADQSLGDVNGAVWFRKKINVPKSMAGQPARLWLGRIVDLDSVFVNGRFSGTTGYQYPPRRYQLEAGVLKEGENTIAIRVINSAGRGGFVLDKPYYLAVGEDTIDLKGTWKYKPGAIVNALDGPVFIRWKPGGLYNAMISPLLNYSIKGVIWYQGESNTGRPLEYRESFPAMINDWRKNWNQGDFPFLFVQLANFMEARAQPSESNWALLRESQLKTLSLPNTGMAVTIDIGEWNDIHPLNKKDVGKRLALAARKVAYGNDEIVYSGPVFQSMEIEGNKATITFTHTGSGLVAKGGDLKAFAIAGPDKQFVWAKAKIEDNKVVVWSEAVPSPVAVRYAWADNPEGANLYNKEGLPASPFRTDE